MKILETRLIDPTTSPFIYLDTIDYEDGREYLFMHEGEPFLYPSVTTSIPNPPEKYLDIWRERVGFEYAAFATRYACEFGERLHNSIERKVAGECYEGHIFEQFLDKGITLGNELFICIPETEESIGVCGRFDYLYEDKVTGEIVLTDFKNAGRVYSQQEVKQDKLTLDHGIQSSKLTKWREQLAFYAKGLDDTYGVTVNKAEIWCYNQGTGCATIPLTLSKQELDKKWERVKTKYLLKSK